MPCHPNLLVQYVLWDFLQQWGHEVLLHLIGECFAAEAQIEFLTLVDKISINHICPGRNVYMLDMTLEISECSIYFITFIDLRTCCSCHWSVHF